MCLRRVSVNLLFHQSSVRRSIMGAENSSQQAAQGGNVLIVDSDSMTGELVQFRLESEGFRSEIITDGRTALDRDLTEFNVILVDLMNQEFNELMFTQAVKRNPDTFNIPVIICSVKSSEDDIVDGLDAGADDYISKPFSSRELIARVRSMIRRRRMMSVRRVSNIVRFNDLVLDLGAGTAFIDGEQISLTRTEYVILAMFMRNRNSFFERVEIRREAWEDDGEVSDRAVDTNISRLRKKLGEYGRHIINRQGFGYGFVE